MVLDELYHKTEEHMKKSLEMLTQELGGIRTGKASPALLDSLRVNYYGSMVPVKQIANVSVPDPRMITIQPWDRGLIQEIEKAIRQSELGLNPQNDGGLIRLPIPPLTEERRKDITKVARADAENARVAVRNVRRDVIADVKEALKEKLISQDEEKKAEVDIQKLTDKYIADIEVALGAKEKELLQV